MRRADCQRRGGDAVGHIKSFAQRGHELAVGHGVWRDEVKGAGQIFAGDQEFDGAGVVGLMNPGDKLASAALMAAQTQLDEIRQHAKGTARCGTKDDAAAQGNLAGARRLGAKERGLPVADHTRHKAA